MIEVEIRTQGTGSLVSANEEQIKTDRPALPVTTEDSVVGIVAEYNPFHNGHLYHLKKSKEITGSKSAVAIMSGNFTQRGEPAIVDKWKRAELAVRNGVDLVIELPFLYACNSAEFFAEGAVKLLTSLGIINYISFGAENDDIEKLDSIAAILANESTGFRAGLKVYSDSGLSFPAARQKAITDIAGEDIALLLKQPNNILAIEYLKQIRRQGSGLKPILVQRTGAGYEELNPSSGIAGASALRKLLYNGQYEEALRYMPDCDLGAKFAWLDHFYTLIIYAVRTKSIPELNEIQSASEGLEYRLKNALDRAHDIQSLIAAVKSKRYTQTRIQRFILQTIFEVTKSTYKHHNIADSGYIRVLGMNQKGRKLLTRIKVNSELQIITNLKKQSIDAGFESKLLELDILASDIYNLVEGRNCYMESDFRKTPFVLE